MFVHHSLYQCITDFLIPKTVGDFIQLVYNLVLFEILHLIMFSKLYVPGSSVMNLVIDYQAVCCPQGKINVKCR